ncbi:MAG TPA: hypothetical protein VFS56_00855 [Gemmatimonadaceae bacterium]|nr:hypothetical protein [Gemmatimonadaceae bacterium]
MDEQPLEPAMPEAANTLSVHEDSREGLPQWAPGLLGLAAGLVALIAVVMGSQSWMLLGSAVVVWTLSGWAIYVGPRPRQREMAILGSLLLLSAAAAALVVLSGLYLRILGPSWKL